MHRPIPSGRTTGKEAAFHTTTSIVIQPVELQALQRLSEKKTTSFSTLGGGRGLPECVTRWDIFSHLIFTSSMTGGRLIRTEGKAVSRNSPGERLKVILINARNNRTIQI